MTNKMFGDLALSCVEKEIFVTQILVSLTAHELYLKYFCVRILTLILIGTIQAKVKMK